MNRNGFARINNKIKVERKLFIGKNGKKNLKREFEMQ